jgi:hypothetical protein
LSGERVVAKANTTFVSWEVKNGEGQRGEIRRKGEESAKEVGGMDSDGGHKGGSPRGGGGREGEIRR